MLQVMAGKVANLARGQHTSTYATVHPSTFTRHSHRSLSQYVTCISRTQVTMANVWMAKHLQKKIVMNSVRCLCSSRKGTCRPSQSGKKQRTRCMIFLSTHSTKTPPSKQNQAFVSPSHAVRPICEKKVIPLPQRKKKGGCS